MQRTSQGHDEQERDARDFLNTLWPNGLPSGELIYGWESSSKRSYPFRSVDDLVTHMYGGRQWAAGTDAYFHLSTTSKLIRPTLRLSIPDCGYLPGVWVDIDIAKTGTTVEAIRDWLATLAFEPTALVWSGGGIHAYWCFKEPQLARACPPHLLGWASVMRTSCPVKLDSVFDITRVLRLPGTMNYKYTPPALVRVVELHPERRFDLYDFPEAVSQRRPPPPERVASGERNTTLFAELSRARAMLPWPDEWLVAVGRALNDYLTDPPLPEAEMMRTIQSVLRYPKGDKAPTEEERRERGLKKLENWTAPDA